MNLFELMATISLNTSEYDKGIDDVQSGADTANAAMESIDTEPAESGLEDVGGAAADAGEDLGEFSDDANDVDLEPLGEEAESAGEGLDELGETAGSAGEDIESFGEDANNVSFDGLSDSAAAAGEDLESIGDSADVAGEGMEGLADTAASVGDDVEAFGETSSSAGGDIEAFGDSAGSVGDDIESIGDAADDASSGIDDFADAAGSAGDDIDDAGDSASSAGDDMSSMGDDASSAAGDLDDVASSADDAADSFDNMGESASGAVEGVEGLGDSMGGTMVSGSTEASNAVSGFSSAIEGFKTGGLVGGVVASVEAIGTGIYNMATETQDASVIIAQGTGATGEALEEMTQQAKNALADVKQSAETDLASVADTLGETNTRFALTGEELQNTTVMMEDFAGVTGQTGVDAVDSLADVMGKWHVETEDMPGLMDKLTAAAQASGASAGDLESALTANSSAFTQMGFSMDDSISLMAAFNQAGGNASDLTGLLKTAVGNLNGEVDDMPGAFMDAISAIENADDATDALNAQVGDTGLTVEDVFGKKANTIIGTVQSSTFSLEDMQDALANSEGLMEETAETSVTFNDKVQGAFNKLKQGCGNAWQSIKGFFTNTKETGEEAGEGLVEGLDESAADVEEAGKGVGQAVIDGASDTLETHSPSKVMESIGGDVTSGLSNGLGDMGSKVKGIFSGVLGNITSFGSDAQKEGSNTGTGFVSNIKNGLSNLSGTVSAPLKSSASEINSFETDSTKTASSTGSGFVSNMKNGLTSLATTVASPMTNALSKATSWGSDMGKESSSSASGFVSKLKTGLSNMSSEVKSKLDPVTRTSSNWGSRLTTEFKGMGKNVINGIIGGMGSMVGNLYTSIKNSLSGLVDKAKGALGISSPSTVFRDEVGAMIGAGLALGIEDSTGEVEDAIDDMVAATDVGDLSIGTATMDIDSSGGQMALWNDNFDKLFDLLGAWLPQLANTKIVMDTGATVGALAAPMNKKLGDLSEKEARR